MSESDWKYRAIIVAPLGDCPAINAAVASNLDLSGGSQTMTVDLITISTGVATHSWCSSKLTASGAYGDAATGKAGLLQLAPSFPSARGYVWCEPENPALLEELRAAFAGITNVAVGEVSSDDVLVELGLARIVVKEE